MLIATTGPQPRAGDHVLAVARDDASAWAFRQVASVAPHAKAGTCEVIFDRPIATTLASPRIELLSRRTPLFGWNAADFATLPPTVRRRAVRGHEAELPGGLRLVTAGETRLYNEGLPDGTPRALALGPGGVVYLATETVLAWAAPDRVWHTARAGAATRGISCLATASDGLLMIGTAGGQVFTTYDPARGFDRLSGGYVLEAGAGTDPPRPVKAALSGGAIRGLMAFGDPASRVMALTDAGLFEYDARGFWLLVTATPLGGTSKPAPIATLLDGVRLAAALVTDDGTAALLAYGSCVSAVVIGPPAPPSTLVLGDGRAGTKDPGASKGDAGSTASTPSLASQWFFPGPVSDLAFLESDSQGGWDSFLVAAGNGVFLCDWSGKPKDAREGLPDGPIDAFVASDLGQEWRVRAIHPRGLYVFDAEHETWSRDGSRSGGTAGPFLAAAKTDTLAIAEPLVLPAEWPGFVLDAPSELQLPTPGPDLPVGSSVVLSSPDTASRAIVTKVRAATFDAFGLRERGLQVGIAPPKAAIDPGSTAPTTLVDRRTTIAYFSGQALARVAPPSVPSAAMTPGTVLQLAGSWGDLFAAGQPPAVLDLPTSGVAGASRVPSTVDGPQVGSPWGLQPLDLAGVAAASAKPDLTSAPRRIALSGQAACVVPASPGGVLSPQADRAPSRALPGLDVMALVSAGDLVLAAVAGQGVFARNDDTWAPALRGLAGPALIVQALAVGGDGSDLRFHLSTDDGIYTAAIDLAWTRLAPPPPGPVAALAILTSGVVLAGGPKGLFACTKGAWSSAAGGSLGAATAVTALLSLGDRALVAPAAGGVLIGSPDTGWADWAEVLAEKSASALCRDGAAIWLAASDGIYHAEFGDAPVRRLETRGVTAVAASAGRVAAAVPGDGIHVTSRESRSWRRLTVGLSNDLMALVFDRKGDLLAGAGARLRLRDASGVWTPLTGPAALGTTSADATAALAGALDAGLCLPLRAALPSEVAKLVADDAVITLVVPGSRWIVGLPGRSLGDGALMLETEPGGIALRPPFGLFSVAGAVGSAPWGLSLAGDTGSGYAEAWPDDLVFVPPKPDAPVETFVRTVVSGTSATDAASTALELDAPVERLLDPAGVKLTANVATATQGETVAGEVLGDGDSSRSFQVFRLRRSPLTFTPTADGGGRSTLRVFVDGIEWEPVGSLVGSGASGRVYVAAIGADDRTEVRFGDGITGSRLPTGRGNVRATYRAGMRDVGDLDAGVTTLLTARPSVSAVRGLLKSPARPPAKGKSDARLSPSLLRSTGRLVTAGDYADFVESLPNVAAARADELRVHGRILLYLSVAWTHPAKAAVAIEAATAQVRQVVAAAQAIPPPPFAVGTCTLLSVRVAARLWLSAEGESEPVRTAAQDALVELFGGQTPKIGTSISRAEIEEVLQALDGVSGVAIDAFHVADHPTRRNEVVTARPTRLLASGLVTPAQMLVLDRTGLGVALRIEPEGGPG